MIKKLTSFACASLMAANIWAGEETKASNFKEVFTKGKFKTDLVLAYEYADRQQDPRDSATGLNFKIRPSFQTAEFKGISAFIQAQTVVGLVDDFRVPNTSNRSDNGSDVIADPEGTRIHQAYFDLTMVPDTLIRIGRQEIILDDARFFGNVGWRLQGQSFDAVKVVNKSVDKLTLTAAYINEIQTIFLTDVADDQLDYIGILHANYNYSDALKVSTFAYFNNPANEADSITYGLRAWGKADLIKYDFTLADQKDYDQGEDIDAQMFRSFIGLNTKPVNFGVGYELYTGNFNTLYGTAHKFLGWSDQFLNTSSYADGVQNYYAQVGAKIAGTTLLARYNYFDVAEGDADEYGNEIELLAKRKFKINDKHAVTALLKAAFFDSNETELQVSSLKTMQLSSGHVSCTASNN